MSQQLQQPMQPSQQQYQPQYQSQPPTGQQFQQSQSGQLGQTSGQAYQQTVPFEVQQAVTDLEKFDTVLEWVKGRASERGWQRAAARCDDLADLAHVEKDLILRQSPFADPIGQATRQTIQQGIQELQQNANDPEIQEALSHAQQVLNSIPQALGRGQTVGQQGMQPIGQQQPNQQPPRP